MSQQSAELAVMEESQDPRDNQHRRAADHRRLFRFDPTVSSGTLLQIFTIAIGFGVAYGTYREDRANMKGEIEAVRVQAAVDRTRTTEMGADIKEINTKLSGIETSLAILKAQGLVQQQRGAR